MQYEVFVRRMDLVKMNALILPRLLQTYIGFGFIVACAAFGGVQSIEKHGVFVWAITSIIIGFGIFLLLMLFTTTFQAITAAAKKGTIGKTIYTLNSDFFIEETQGTETKTRWESITGIYKFNNYLFVRINAMRIHIIPKREFESDKSFEDFCETVIGHESYA